MAWRKSPLELVELFNQVLPGDLQVERRQMFGYPSAFVNGNMFAGLHQDNFILRLAEKDRATMQEQEGAEQFMPMPGRIMREYVALPGHILADVSVTKRWLKRSLAYAATLPPKVKKLKKSKPVK
jgi:TfoX/Sxy family transcriptional regulator of competence genes